MPFNMSAWNETLVDSIDIEDYVTKSLGPKRLALNWLIPLTVVYSLIFLSGIVGNVCTCVVIGRNQYMQTATNCYLFNLAIADMMTLLFAMPMELYTLWEQYPWHLGLIGCWMRSLIPETTAYASILTIVVFSTERYIAICHPIRQQTKAKLSSAIRNIAIVWLVSIVCALPFAYYAKVNYVTLPDGQLVEEASWCGLSFVEGNEVWIYAMGFSTIVFFIIPFVLIIVMYVFIWLALRRSHRMHRSTSESAQCRLERERSKAQSRRVVIRMLGRDDEATTSTSTGSRGKNAQYYRDYRARKRAEQDKESLNRTSHPSTTADSSTINVAVAVVAGFFLCWAPFHAQRLLFVIVTSYSEWTETLRNVNHNLFTLAGCFYYFNSTINPILYSVMSNRFRVAFREKLCAGPPSLWCICCCCFCCVKDYESRSQQTPKFYRNSNSHSSVRSYVSYQQNLMVNVNNNNHQRRSLAVDYCQQSGGVTNSVVNGKYATMIRSPSSTSSIRRYGNSLTVSPPGHQQVVRIRCGRSSGVCGGESSSSSREDNVEEKEIVLAEKEIEEALRPDIDKFEDKNDCVSCTDCSLLFPPKVKTQDVPETSTTELSHSDHPNVEESVV